jgi:ribonuclease P protein subunit POP4
MAGQVKQAKNPCLVGLSGIVLLDRENTFVLITEKNALKSENHMLFSMYC